MLLRVGGEAARVVEGGLDVVDAARPDHDHQPVVGAAQYVDHFGPPADHRLLALIAQRQLLQQRRRRRQLDDSVDPQVADAVPRSLLGPDHHFVFTILQGSKILLSGGVPAASARGTRNELDGARPKRCMSVRRDAARPDA